MFEEFSRQEQYGLVAVFAVATAAAFGAGTVVSGGPSPAGAVTADSSGDASADDIRQQVQDLMDQQMQQQRQQLQLMAQQSEEFSADDLSMDASVTDVSRSEFGSLYRVTVSIQGQVPGRQGGLQQIDQEQEVYISPDGRYLFQQPTDLEQPRQPQQPTGGQPPTSGQ